MRGRLKLTFQKGDILAVFLVILIAVSTAIIFLPSSVDNGNAVVQIRRDGSLIEELPLQSACRFEAIGDYINVIEILDGAVWISESDCPGEDCVHSGKIRSAGRSIVCLPNRVEVRIVGKEDDVDFIVR